METVLTLAEDKCVAIDTWDMMCKYVQHLTQRLQGLENPPRTLQLSRFPAKNKTMELRAQINLMRQNADLLFSQIEKLMEEEEMEEEDEYDGPMTEVAMEKEIIKEEPLKEGPIEDAIEEEMGEHQVEEEPMEVELIEEEPVKEELMEDVEM